MPNKIKLRIDYINLFILKNKKKRLPYKPYPVKEKGIQLIITHLPARKTLYFNITQKTCKVADRYKLLIE